MTIGAFILGVFAGGAAIGLLVWDRRKFEDSTTDLGGE
jgi:hypothetical protein